MKPSSTKSATSRVKSSFVPTLLSRRLFQASTVAALLCFGSLAARAALSVGITSPHNGDSITSTGTNVVGVSFTATSSSYYLNTIALYNNGALIKSVTLPAGLNTVSAQFPLLLLTPTADSLTVVATDTSGASATSTPVVVNVSYTATPALQTNGLVLWLKADTGVVTNSTTNAAGFQTVTEWDDQSGQTNNAYQSTLTNCPELDIQKQYGLLAVKFDVTAPGTLANAMYMIVSNNPSIANLTTNFTFLAVGTEFDRGRTYAILSKTTGAYKANPFSWHFTIAPSGGVEMDLGAGGNNTVVNASIGTNATTKFNIIGSRAGNNTLSETVNFINGSTATIGSAAVADGGAPLNIGQGTATNTGMYGEIAELICFSNTLSDSDYLAAQLYLSGKYFPTLAVVQNASSAVSAPVVTIDSPASGATFDTSTNPDIPITVSVSSVNPISTISYYANGQIIGVTSVGGQPSPYQFEAQASSPGTIVLTAVATDILGFTGTSDPVTNIVTGTNPTPPSPATNGLVLWLEPDAGIITNSDGSGTIAEWDDQSGLTNNAYQGNEANAPFLDTNAINGFSVPYFNPGINGGNPQYMQVPDAPSLENFTTNFTFFAVAEPLYSTAQYDIISKTFAANYFAFPFEWRFDAGGTTELDLSHGSTTVAFNISTYGAPQKVFNVVSVQVGSGQITQYLGYTQNGSSSLGTNSITDGGNPLYIGNREVLNVNMYGDIAEILCYSNAISAADRQQTVNYLSYKYGIAYPSFSDSGPVVSIPSPTNGSAAIPGQNVTVWVSATSPTPGTSLTSLGCYVNGTLIGTAIVTGQSIYMPYQVFLAAAGTYNIAFKATDNLGGSTTSGAVTVNAAYDATPTAPTNGLAIWLRADAGVVTNSDGTNSAGYPTVREWDDQSGSGNNAYQSTAANAPEFVANVINGLPAIRFDQLDTGGHAMFLTVASVPGISALTSNFTFLAVADEFDRGRAYAIMSKTSGAFKANPFVWHWNVNGFLQTDLGAGGAVTLANATANAVTASTFGLLGARAGNNTLSDYVNFVPDNPTTIGSAAITDAGSSLNIGQGSALNSGMYGYIPEILIYTNSLSDTDFAQAESYLAAKYHLTPLYAGPGIGSPSLLVGGSSTNLQFSWPLNYVGFVLEGSTNLDGGAWVPIATNPPNFQVNMAPAAGNAQFFRLHRH